MLKYINRAVSTLELVVQVKKNVIFSAHYLVYLKFLAAN